MAMNLKKIDNPFGGLTYYTEITTSTMSEALSLVDQALDLHGTLFLTDFQTNGIGRVPGRVWESETKKNLMFTLVLSRKFVGRGFGMIPLKAGLAIAKTISELSGVETKIKWPNDVVVDGKKISGVLCQSRGEYIFVGIGLNVNQLEFQHSLKDVSTSLSKLTNNGYSIEMVLSNLLNNFYKVLNSNSWLLEINNVLYKKGEQVEFLVGNPNNNNLAKGTLIGLDDQGKVLIKDKNEIEKGYLSGEFK